MLGSEVKTFEIRDEGINISIVAIRLDMAEMVTPDAEQMKRGGWNSSNSYKPVYVIKLQSEETQWDPYKWDSARTMLTAHNYIVQNWDSLTSGQVIDVSFILRESTGSKINEWRVGL